MKNSPETLKNRNAKRKAWKHAVDPSTIPKTAIKVCKDCGELRECSWNYSFTQTGVPEYRARCISCFSVYSSTIRKRNQHNITKHHREYNRTRKQRLIEYLGGKCAVCGYSECASSLTFHHKDRNTKYRNVCSMLDWSWEKLQKEVDKCELLCFNCHMALHEEENKT